MKIVGAALFLVKCSFAKLTPAVFRPLYCTLVRPHFEYAIQGTPCMVKGLHHPPYILRLDLCSPKKRRLRANLILAYGIFHNRYDLPQNISFTPPPFSHLRGHVLKLRNRSVHLASRKAAFSVRIVEPWNKLPPSVSNSHSVANFKNRLDVCWETIFDSADAQ